MWSPTAIVRSAARGYHARMSEIWNLESLAKLILGLDSLAVTQLMLSIQESTGVWVDEGLLTPENLESCESLATCVDSLLRSDA